MNNNFNRFINFGSIADKEARKNLADFIYGLLKNNGKENVSVQISATDTDNFADAIKNILSNKTMLELCAQDESLAEQVTGETLDFINKTKRKIIKQENPFEEECEFLKVFKDSEKDNFEKIWEKTAPFIDETYSKETLDMDFYYKEFQNSLKPNGDKKQISFQSVKEHFTEKWEGLLFQKQLQWELAIIEEERKKFCEELYKSIEKLKKLQELLAPFTGELGRLWDMSKGNWQKINFDILKQYAELLERDNSLRELAEMLGRMHSAEKEYEEETFTDTIIKPDWKVEHASKADLIGVHESDDISSMLPAEAALLADPVSESIFYKKFAEKKLQTFEYQARILSSKEEQFENKRQKAKEDKKGPIIICVDTSGSMHGTPETVAKTLCFALLKIAVRDNRKCYLLSFSTGIETLNLTDIKNNLDKLISFLSMSFHGGTDANPALNEALRMLETQDYKKADVLVISDFIMPAFDDQTLNKIKSSKENKTKFHSLVIGDSGNKNAIEEFDNNWVYDSHDKKQVLQLVRNIRSI
jgi:uncharacterized protein with von Willebrand factor type A (vWA) domain